MLDAVAAGCQQQWMVLHVVRLVGAATLAVVRRTAGGDCSRCC